MYLYGHLSGIENPALNSLAVCLAEFLQQKIRQPQSNFQIKCPGGPRLLPPAESGLVGARDVISQRFWPVRTLSRRLPCSHQLLELAATQRGR